MKLSLQVSPEREDIRGNERVIDWEVWLRRIPLKEKMSGGNAGDFDEGCRVRRMPSEREK